ncbi:MAG: Zn-dependent oligopeptidase [Planctomycetes bacterium]|nr:Zn-dependent oligopeptidase [Planctomycetota bacterium]MCP4771309.1 Zn-dependent oligopeptidase [Planctomycetota bacterium]MCP4860458.1 Zn-dependent oligopeptidase [Planctomycetota bacterium]
MVCSRMTSVLILVLATASLGFSCQSPADGAKPDATSGASKKMEMPADTGAAFATGTTLADFQEAAAHHGVILELPRLDWGASEIGPEVDRILTEANVGMDAIANQDPRYVTFASSFGAMDDVLDPVISILNQLWLMKETRVEDDVRAACNAQVQKVDTWMVALNYREDLYALCQAYATRYENGERATLRGEDLKLFSDTMRDYRRSGFDLDAATRAEVAELQNKHNELTNQFDTNITDAQVELLLTAEEMDGVPDSFLAASKTADGRYRVRVTVTPDFATVMDNAKSEDVRRRVNTARYQVAMDTNGPLLNEIVALRAKIASKLGYANWADYKTEPKMAGSGQSAVDFCEDLVAGLEPKFRGEVNVLTKLKREETGNPVAEIMWWDYRYYQNMLMKNQYGVDAEALRNYFKLDDVIAGMFDIYQHIFGLTFHRIDTPYAWIDDLQLYVVTDAATGEPLGCFYLDMFPRPGKYNHFAQFDIMGGKRLADGRYRRPAAALVCNFTPGVGDQPALMSHYEVETVFHEFGHAMHAVLTRTKYGQFSGGSVPRDFVEAPSQMFENWVWDVDVLQRFAVDYRDPSKKIPAELIEKMKEANLATAALGYRRQMGLALSDLRMHLGGVSDAGAVCNATNSETLFAVPPGTNFAAYWGHLTGYDAGYYGYGWADSIAADLATAFSNAPDRFLDQEVGMRLRREIYEVGGSRDVTESVRKFLGRDSDNRAFLKQLGIGN